MQRKMRPAILMIRKMAGSGVEPQILVQYLVLRKDLSQAPFSWPTGALVAQACHAATAALHLHRDHPHTAAYLRELGRMRKVVLEVRGRYSIEGGLSLEEKEGWAGEKFEGRGGDWNGKEERRGEGEAETGQYGCR
uniref:peptidyl-tRNA hydrolase n=1 Tax=Rattus norvegicus TaxID=10116 RepID=A0ABK0LCK3_RAT